MAELAGICAVILAAGAGSRLGYPNERGGKPMVKALGKPLLAYGLERLAGARQRSGTQSERGAGGEP